MPIRESGSFYIVCITYTQVNINSGAFPVCCENIAKRAPGPIALPIQTAPDPLFHKQIALVQNTLYHLMTFLCLWNC